MTTTESSDPYRHSWRCARHTVLIKLRNGTQRQQCVLHYVVTRSLAKMIVPKKQTAQNNTFVVSLLQPRFTPLIVAPTGFIQQIGWFLICPCVSRFKGHCECYKSIKAISVERTWTQSKNNTHTHCANFQRLISGK